MQGFNYLVAAYIVIWLGLLLFLGAIVLRIRGVQTELAAVREMVREQRHGEEL